jgi:hypothetical protein
MIYYFVQKKKYTSRLPYLYYEPTIEGYDFSHNLLMTASKRFAYKFSMYNLDGLDIDTYNAITTKKAD